MLCRIYKKNNAHRPMDHDKDDSMEDMLGSVPPSLSVGIHQNGTLHLAKGITSYGALYDMSSDQNNFFEGIISNDIGTNRSTNSMSHHHLVSSSASKPEALPILPLKRTLQSLYLTDEDQAAAGASSSSKRFQGGDVVNGHDPETSVVRTDHGSNSSIATLLSQLPQTAPPLHQLGSLGDGIFRSPYQIPGMNWYT